MPSDPVASFAPSVAVARWMVGPEGLRHLADAVAALDADERELAIGTRLRDNGVDAERARAVLDAAVARRRARGRYADADGFVLTTSALEQASHPAVSTARAERFAGAATVTDLCCGAGSDALAIAGRGPSVTAVDLDEARLVLLDHNAAVRGVDITTVAGDALSYPVVPGAFVHADPGRRAHGRRLRRLAELLPPVPVLLAHTAAAGGVGIALSPAVDLADPGLPGEGELEFFQVGAQLLESTLWTGALRREGAEATATLLDPSGHVRHTRSRRGRGPQLPVVEVGQVLLEPRAAAVRARLHDQLGEEVGARRIARHRSLLTADEAPHSPWFEAYAIDAVLPLRAKAIAAWLRSTDVGPIEIVTHGVDADPVDWWRRIGRPPRGPGGARVHLVRLDAGAVCLVARPV